LHDIVQRMYGRSIGVNEVCSVQLFTARSWWTSRTQLVTVTTLTTTRRSRTRVCRVTSTRASSNRRLYDVPRTKRGPNSRLHAKVLLIFFLVELRKLTINRAI